MKFKSRLVRTACSLAAGLLLGQAALAGIVFAERPPGAGDTPATAQVTFNNQFSALDGITGVLNAFTPQTGAPVYEVDLFKIQISDFSTFSARTVPGDDFDTALYLFDALGFGVAMNDDNPGDLFSTLPAGSALANGIYFLAVALGGFDAFDSMGDLIFAGGLPTGEGPLASWTPAFAANSEFPFSYRIELTGAQVAVLPEPASLALVMLALAGAGFARRRAP